MRTSQTLRIDLRIEAPPAFAARSFDPALEDVRAILVDACRAPGLRMRFEVSGFGQDRWPVDAHDLAILLEQLPSALRAVEARLPTDLDFYEQGLQRFIALAPVGEDRYSATCTSWTDWRPDPAVEEISRARLLGMLRATLDEFVLALRVMAPALAMHPWTRGWLEDARRP